jgi:hypothetical protein
MFSDDTKIYKSIYDKEDQRIMQADINKMLEWSENWLLKFHPDKCHVLEVGKKRTDPGERIKYKMGDTELKIVNEEKDLGVVIDKDLSFEQHINAKVKTANKVMGIIRRTYKYLNIETFKKLYVGLVRPHLEYAQAIWSPYKKSQLDKLEQVQRRATKQVPGLSHLSYKERLTKLKLPTLVYRRARGDMIEMFKMTSPLNLYDPRTTDFIKRKDNRTTCSMTLRRDKINISEDTPKLKIRDNYFTCRTELPWNNSSTDVGTSPSVNTFKNRLDKLWRRKNLFMTAINPSTNSKPTKHN